MCAENAGRSQMAEALAALHGKGEVEASSAGTMPANTVQPLVVKAVLEKEVDLSTKKPKLLTTSMLQEAEDVIVMGCGTGGFCSTPLFKKVVDARAKEKPIEEAMQIRDEIEREALKLLSETEK